MTASSHGRNGLKRPDPPQHLWLKLLAETPGWLRTLASGSGQPANDNKTRAGQNRAATASALHNVHYRHMGERGRRGYICCLSRDSHHVVGYRRMTVAAPGSPLKSLGTFRDTATTDGFWHVLGAAVSGEHLFRRSGLGIHARPPAPMSRGFQTGLCLAISVRRLGSSVGSTAVLCVTRLFFAQRSAASPADLSRGT